MKKLVSILLSLVSIIIIAFAFVGCGERQCGEQGTEAQNGGANVESEGILYGFATVLENGWIDETDLKIIACGYYEWLNIEDNPYSGLWEEPTDELSEEIQAKMIQQYFFRTENTTLLKYYGTYDGNIVVTLGDAEIIYDEDKGTDIELGGIIFPKLDLYPIRVYHYPEQKDPSLKVTGKLYDIEDAGKNGLLEENDLKSISCYFYDLYEYKENPYCGMYEKLTQKLSKEVKQELKQAYLEQIDEYPNYELDGVKIRIIGEYNGYIVAEMTGYSCRLADYFSDKEIGGVIFCQGCWINTFLYKK